MQAPTTMLARGSIVLLASSLVWAGPQQPGSGSGSQDPQQLIQKWPDASRKAARNMIEKYGQPDGVTDSHLVWRENGPWVRTIVHKEPVQHNFPKPHEDVLEQFINYKVPPEKFSDLAKFDGSLVAYRTNGEMSVRCDREAANIVGLNLANDIIEGSRSVDEAREFYAQTIQQVTQGEQPEYAQNLQFETRTASVTADPGEPLEVQTAQAELPDQSRSSSTTRAGSGDDEAVIPSARLEGMTVVTSEDEEVGEVTRVMDKAGEEIVLIQLDEGFLGIGEQELTLPVADLALTFDGQIRTRLTRDELKSMAEPQNRVGGRGGEIEDDREE
ncbi:MAG TPA: PRC-barrel domain-containing protein [Woeseiaceae bacterium]|nr:PRC-barrel domain-containing protein [Woeseiaceae bacterium]